jgi:hypothetical protein
MSDLCIVTRALNQTELHVGIIVITPAKRPFPMCKLIALTFQGTNFLPLFSDGYIAVCPLQTVMYNNNQTTTKRNPMNPDNNRLERRSQYKVMGAELT